MRHHDLVIIGTGSGNSVITPDLEGLDIAIVEEGTFGGTCLNVGCIPTKMFVLPADRVREASDAARLGVTFGEPSVDWPAIRDRIFTRIDPIAAGGEDYRRGQSSVSVYAARATFVGDRQLALSTGEQISADRIVLAAGGRPRGLDLDGLGEADPERGLHTSDTIMRLAELPESMIVLGGGFVGCEFAHVFSALGVQVTQVARGATLLTREEDEIREAYTQEAGSLYAVRCRSTVTAAHRVDGQWVLTLATPEGVEQVRAPVVLMALGRTPNSDRLDCAAGGIELHDDGRVMVDKQLRTTAPGVWALGDLSSAHQLKHVANHEARIVAHNVAVDCGARTDAPRELDDRPVPHAVFGHPQVASFGPTRRELERDGIPFVSATQRFGDTAYGWALEDTTGVLTVHARADGEILSAHCVGPMASTLIQPLIQAASLGQRAQEVARGQYWIHPALAEVVENALLGLPQG